MMRGINLLNEHQVPFHVITVLTAESLNYPDELFDFYTSQRITRVGFNVEEIEGPNKSSSLQGSDMKKRFRRFLSRFLDLAYTANPPMSVREFETSAGAVLNARYGQGSRTQENKPWAIVNVDCDGNFGTYSPELLGLSSERYGDFALGNVAENSLEDAIASPRFQAMVKNLGVLLWLLYRRQNPASLLTRQRPAPVFISVSDNFINHEDICFARRAGWLYAVIRIFSCLQLLRTARFLLFV